MHHESPLFHHCVGAVDGMLQIQSPASSDTQTASRFWCRKGFYALNVQGVCDSTMRFLHVGINAPGSVHDCAAWALGSVSQSIANGLLPEPYYILGDAGYKGCDRVMTPFVPQGTHSAHLNADQVRFNYLHSSARIKIECAWGLLVNRWEIFARHFIFDLLILMNHLDLVLCGDR